MEEVEPNDNVDVHMDLSRVWREGFPACKMRTRNLQKCDISPFDQRIKFRTGYLARPAGVRGSKKGMARGCVAGSRTERALHDV